MSRHKKFHSLSGKGRVKKIYAFRHRPNARAAALQESMKKIAANTPDGEAVVTSRRDGVTTREA